MKSRAPLLPVRDRQFNDLLGNITHRQHDSKGPAHPWATGGNYEAKWKTNEFKAIAKNTQARSPWRVHKQERAPKSPRDGRHRPPNHPSNGLDSLQPSSSAHTSMHHVMGGMKSQPTCTNNDSHGKSSLRPTKALLKHST